MIPSSLTTVRGLLTLALAAILAVLTACGRSAKVSADGGATVPSESVNVGVVPVTVRSMAQNLSISSELVPFQEIDVYAKVAGYVKQLNVDYGTHVKEGQVMAVLEIPELQMQLQQDEAAIKSAGDEVTAAEHQLNRRQAQSNVLHLQFDRLDKVSKEKAGLVAQQEVDDAQARDLAAEAEVEAANSNLAVLQGKLDASKAKKQQDQVLFDYSRITAPFSGIVTQRFANQGTLMQAGTASSTQAMPLVRLSQDNLFRLVIPVPESYVRYIKVGDPVKVSVPSLNTTYPGKVARFSVDVKEDTRTMHTEVDIPNRDGKLIPGVYAEATLELAHKDNAIAVPLQAVAQEGTRSVVYVVNPANKIEERNVTLGIQTANEAEVLAGLQPGDMVVVSDRSSLKPGQEVHPAPVQLVQYQDPGTK